MLPSNQRFCGTGGPQLGALAKAVVGEAIAFYFFIFTEVRDFITNVTTPTLATYSLTLC